MKLTRIRFRLICDRLLIILACMLTLAPAHAMVRTWTGLADGESWSLAGNWSPDSDVPQSGESVVITNGTVLINIDTPWLDSLAISNATLMFTNWTTRLQATNVFVQNDATLRPVRGFLDLDMSNRVYVVTSNLFVETGGRLFADALGYRAEGTTVSGPGKGGSSGSRGAGGSYGGMGGRTGDALPVYGSTNAPTDPGSTGGFGHSPAPGAGDGGGAIRIIADHIVLNGTITANGGNAGTYGGGGSGGGIYITCNSFAATGGIIRAHGGRAGTANTGEGGGGRIAIDSTQFIHPVDVDISILPGDANRLPGQIGTLYLPDTGLLTETLSQFSGVRLFIPDFTSWTVTNLTVTSGPLVVEEPVFKLNVESNLTVLSNAWFCIGAHPSTVTDGYADGFSGGTTNPTVTVGGDLRLDQGILTLGGYRQDAISHLVVGNDLMLTNAAQLHVYPGQSNALHRYGGYVSVTGKTTVAAGTPSWIMPHSHARYGSAVLFDLDELDIRPGSGFNADDKGFAWIGTTCYAPSYGASAGSRGAGSGHGGKGGDISVAGGQPYGLTNAPILPGAPGGYGHGTGFAQPGGGAIRIHASTVTLDGVIKSSQTLGNAYGGGGGGGGIFITCDDFSGTATGVLRADGGNGGTSGTPQGGGGGGRIAVAIGLSETDIENLILDQPVAGLLAFEQYAAYQGTISVTNGIGNGTGDPGSPGTASFLSIGGSALTIEGEPEPYGAPYPDSYGTFLDYPPDAWVTNTVASPAEEADGLRRACFGWILEDDEGGLIDSGSNTQAVFQLTTNVVLTWRWTNEYYLSVLAGPNGSVNSGAVNGWYTNGTVVYGIQATPDTDYIFSMWIGDDVPEGAETENPLTVTMDQSRKVEASFASTAGQLKTWTGTGAWESSTNWVPVGMPSQYDDAVIESGTVLFANSRSVRSLIVSNGATMVFTNWATTLTAVDSVTVWTNGMITLPPAFETGQMSNRVSIVSSNLTVDAGGRIDALGRGYAIQNGDGAGSSSGSRGSGAGHGGRGGRGNSAGGGFYGSVDWPQTPGSGGGFGHSGGPGTPGGGVIYIEATNVTVNGVITADSETAGQYGGGGAGGSILIRCGLIDGDGLISADGGSGGYQSNTGGGGGGRIAILYGSAQEPIPTQISAQGGARYSTPHGAAGMGTMYLPDDALLTTTLSTLSGRIIIPGFNQWSVSSLTVSHTTPSFGEEEFQLTVSGDLIVQDGGWLAVGGTPLLEGLSLSTTASASNPVITVAGNLMIDSATLTVGGLGNASRAGVQVSGGISLTNSAAWHVYGGETNVTTAVGAQVTSLGIMNLATGCWVYVNSNPTNGGSPFFTLGELRVASNAGFQASARGFDAAQGPGRGVSSGSNFSSGGGHGGRGGDSSSQTGGTAYGVTNAPRDAGSGGGRYDVFGGRGGGFIGIMADRMILHGSILANGQNGNGYNAGGAGGGILLVGGRIETSVTTTLLADGGNRGNSYASLGGGGGGRIAAWIQLSPATRQRVLNHDLPGGAIGSESHPAFIDASVSAEGGAGYEDGERGSTRFLMVPGTLFLIR